MSIIDESILSLSIELLIKKLTSEGLRLFARQQQIEADLIKWKKMLLKIKAVLEEAEDKQTRKQSVKTWVNDLQNLAYDVEDILDEFETETLKRKLFLEPQHQPTSSKLRKLLPACCGNFNPQTIKFDLVMMSKIKDINTRLQDISTQKDQLELKEISRGKCRKVRERLQETPLVNETKVYGRDKDKEEIAQWLLRDDLSSDDGFSVVPITGMGGLGKTTLAQLVYNDETVESHFDFKAWACVSEDFDVVRVTNTVLHSIDGGASDVNDLNLLQEELKRKLQGKKFLLVLDDIWNENPNDWELLSRPFQSGSRGSKIIVTTRNRGVSSMVATGEVHLLRTLSDDDCLRVFTQHALRRTDFSSHQHLKAIGEKIVNKCNGLPLAAKTLGGLLRNKYNRDDWEKVLNSKVWDLPEEKSDIMGALKVSYYYLPAHLKQCFAYCSLLPKDYAFYEREMVLLWMAEGFLQIDTRNKIEAIGHGYFQELQSRSFFQQSSTDTSKFVMHDLINDLAQWAAREICFRMEDMLESSNQPKFFKNIRHLSYIRGKYDGIKRFEIISDAEHLRTFLPVMLSNGRHDGWLAYKVLNMLLKLRRLRVLSLRGYQISKLPDSISDLKCLRHLDLSETDIEALPESISTLYNLLTLRLENCLGLKKLCADMGNLIKLRHLHNTNAGSLEEMPLRIGKLTCLQTLCSFVVGKDTGSTLRELKSLKNLSGTLKISKLENVKDVSDAVEADMKGKKNLKVLFLEWCSDASNSTEVELGMHVLERLKPHKKLEELTISRYGGSSYPMWLGDASFSNLVFLRFEGCGMCTSLPSVGQLPSLKHLFIIKMAGIKRVGSEFYGYGCSIPFTSLETLCFEDMQEWEDWIPHGCGQEDDAGFPCLRELRIVRCSKLLGILPECLPSLEMLVIQRCEQLLVSFPSLPALCKLEVEGCKDVVRRSTIDLSSLHSASFRDMSDQGFLIGLFKQELPRLKELQIAGCEEITYLWQNGISLLQDISSLHQLQIFRCPQLLSLIAEGEEDQQQGLPGTVQSLSLSECQCLARLPQALLSLSSLAEMHITSCDKLISFPEVALPSQLTIIDIWRCNSLESLPESWIDKSTSLQTLNIYFCDSLTYIARVQLPRSLKQLKIGCCNNLRNLIFKDQVPLIHEEDISIGSSKCPSVLKYLHFENCPSLMSVWLKNELPDTLERINIWGCENVKILPDNLSKLRHLQEVRISRCSNLVSFPEGGLISPKLTNLSIGGCEKLEELPCRMYNLTSLQHLTLVNCPSIVSFPMHGFPNNLTSLEIGDLRIWKPLFDWGFHRFTSLQHLSISGGCLELISFLPENTGMMLPASLTKLSIEKFPNLECLSSIFENLTSLEYLGLNCCPKLKSFPENGLPDSLLQLYVYGCPLLQKWCKENEEYRSMIYDNIPYVVIDDKEVFDDSTDEDLIPPS